MAEAAVLNSLGWVASPVLKMLFDRAQKLLGSSFNEKRKRLEASTLPRLYLVIEKAEKSPNKHMVEAWVKRLKDAYYEAEEAIDLLEYELLDEKVKARRKSRIFGLLFQSVGRNVEKNKLKCHMNKIIEIAEEANKFCDLSEVSSEYTPTLLSEKETVNTCNPYCEKNSQHSDKVVGREKDTKIVADLLINKTLKSKPGSSIRPGISVIAITGHSGIGKTTLAQSVYQYIKEQNERKEEKCFDILSWVPAPRKFKAADVVKRIVQTIKTKDGALHNDNYDHSVPLEALQEQMKGILGSKKFLLVLDDFWCDAEDDREQWEKLICCLSGGSQESKILLTTQSVHAAKHATYCGVGEIYFLKELAEGESFELFMHHACWSSIPEEFKNIGRQIAAKLKGDPGAAKIVGRQLREKPDITHWQKIEENDWSTDNDNMMKARIWSYQQLPAHLQRCFTFCCLFPKGFGFSARLLIDLWMAEGFIKQRDEEERMEDVGESYLNELLCRYFLEKFVYDGKIYYRLHDLLHDLAERVQGDDFLRIDSSNPKNDLGLIRKKLSRSENIYHISLPGSMLIKLKDEICHMKNLRTLVCVENNCTIKKKELKEILENLKKLRVLHLPWCGDDLPDTIGNLKKLHYLWFGGSLPLKELPASICKLYLLQTLYLPSYDCKSLPKEFSQLVSLRHIDIKGDATSYISDVGRLTSLQRLHKFTVRNERGHELHQLENLNQLSGILCIAGLENVRCIDDAVKADLQSKNYLEELEFQWNSDERATDDFPLLDALHPHPSIKGLKIERFSGIRFPNWLLGQNSKLRHVIDLRLVSCSNVEEISCIAQSLPSCQVLGLSALSSLKDLPLLPPKLTSLTLSHIPQLCYFSENDLLMKEERKKLMLGALEQITEYMKLRYKEKLFVQQGEVVRRILELVTKRWEAGFEVNLQNSRSENNFQEMEKINPLNYGYSVNELLEALNLCMRWHLETMLNKNVESLFILPSSLTQLEITSCSITTDALSTCIQRLVSLSELRLIEIHTITSLPDEEALCSLNKLNSLHIEACYLLSSLGGIRSLSSLTELTLKNCLNLNSSNQQLPSSLEMLSFYECVFIDEILNQSYLPVLRVLLVDEFLNVGPLCERRGKPVLNVGHLSSLKELIIYGFNGCLQGLNSLLSLYKLEVRNKIDLAFPSDKCSIRIENVCVDYKPEWVKEMLSDKTLSTIESLTIYFFHGNYLDDEIFQFLTSLKRLYLKKCNITHLPSQLKNLDSLEYLDLDNCPNLHEMEYIPKNLLHLHITDCPALSEKFNDGGSYEVEVYERTTFVKFQSKDLYPFNEAIITEHHKELVTKLGTEEKEREHKIQVAWSDDICNEKTNEMLSSLDHEEGYGSLMSDSSISVKEFNIGLLSFLRRILARFEEETRACDRDIREEKKVQFEKEIIAKFEETFKNKVACLREQMRSLALSNLRDQLDRLFELEGFAIFQVLQDNYIRVFDEHSRADVHPEFEESLNKCREGLIYDVKRMADEEARIIQMDRSYSLSLLSEGSTILCVKGEQELQNINIPIREETLNALDAELRLHWSNSSSELKRDKHHQILQALRSNTSIECLEICGYPGKVCPYWFNSDLLSGVKKIYLTECNGLKMLPALGQLPQLKKLIIESMDLVRQIGVEFYGNGLFPSLEEIEISNMRSLKEWSFPRGVQSFPKLHKLVIDDCPTFLGPEWDRLPALKELEIRRSEALKGWHDLVTLVILRIKNCRTIFSLPEMEFLYALEELEIYNCPKLRSLPKKGLPVSLQKLYLFRTHHDLEEQIRNEDGREWDKVAAISRCCCAIYRGLEWEIRKKVTQGHN